MSHFLSRLIDNVLDRIADRVAEKLAPLLSATQEQPFAGIAPVGVGLADSSDPQRIDASAAVNKGIQTLLALRYQELLHRKLPLPAFTEVGFRCFSQGDEDGILLYLFSLIGTTNKKVVEICAGNGIECNSANLIVHHGWIGLLFDGAEENIQAGKEFYAECKDTFIWPPTLVQAWITAENVNALLRSHGVQGEIDLLCLDLDGVDYWIWKAIDCIQPRVVVVEFQYLWGPDKSVTVPYKPDFRADFSNWFAGVYCGASLAAFVKLAREKGYRLVACQRFAFNAFFVRSGIGEDVLPEIPASKCFDYQRDTAAIPRVLANISNGEWVEV